MHLIPLRRAARSLFLACTLGASASLGAAEVVEMAPDLNSTVGQLKTMSRVPEAEIAPASDEAALALKRMQLPPGLTASLWAAEPMLANPVAFNFDERGRIFVAETYRYRSSVLDIRDYLWTLEDEMANRTLEDQRASILRHFGAGGVKALSIESERVRLLEDTDHDGKADRSTLFAEGFNSDLDGIASGVLAHHGKVYLTNIPSLWLLENETKAGAAAKRTELSRGYGLRFNFTGHDMHGLILGPDGKLYFSIGDRSARATAIDGSLVDTPDTGSVLRCNLDGTKLELFATGLRNPQSLVFNEFGDLLTGDNDSDQGDEERLVHLVEGGDSGWRIGYQHSLMPRAGVWNIEQLWRPRFKDQAAYLLPPICNIEDGPSGITYYPGTGLNETYRGSIFITHFKGGSARSGINTYNVKPNGASYAIADSRPFLTSSLPTDVKFGPDGRLYISDWSEGWPKSKKGRIYAIADPLQVNQPLVKETQALIASDFSKKSPKELARLLEHADWRVRLEAQYALAENSLRSAQQDNPSAVALATVAKQNESPLARRHAVWGLGQIAHKNRTALAALRPLVRDPDSEVRAQAIKVLGESHDATQGTAFSLALKDENNRVKFFAALSLGKLAQPEFAPALLRALEANNDEDPYLRHALVMGLVGCNSSAALKAGAADPSRAVRLGVLLAYRRLGSPEIARFLADADSFIVVEAARAINDAPINAALPALAALIDQPIALAPAPGARPSNETTAEPTTIPTPTTTRSREPEIAPEDTLMLRVLNANFRLGTPAQAAALAAYAERSEAPAALRVEALTHLAAWGKPPARDRVVGVFRPLTPATRESAVAISALQPKLEKLLAPTTPRFVQAATIAAIEALKLTSAADLLFAAVQNETLPAATRVDALKALAHFKDRRLAEAAHLASAATESALRLAALPIVADLSPDAAAPVVINLALHGSIAEQKTAFETLGTLSTPAAETFLNGQLDLLQNGQVPPAVQVELLEAAAKRSDSAVKQTLESYQARVAKSEDPLASFRVALLGGKAENGRRIFNEHPVLACTRCHKVGTEGGEAGPNLTTVGTTYPREYLLESVVKPNAKIAPGFENVIITLKSGVVQAGMLTTEDDAKLTLKLPDPAAPPLTIPKAEIAKRDSAPSSMPEIYGQILSKSELRDVVEYLSTLTESRESRAANATRVAQAGATGTPARVDPPLRALRDLPRPAQ